MSDKQYQEKELAIRLLENVNAHHNNRIAELEKALEQIANFDVEENHGEVNEWTEASSFSTCQEIARNAIKGGGE